MPRRSRERARAWLTWLPSPCHDPVPRFSLRVHNFGGAPVADAAAVLHAATIIAAEPRPIRVDVSAACAVNDIFELATS